MIKPMLLHKANHVFSDENYITELKLDGIRLILSTVGGTIRYWTRHGTPCTDRFPELAKLDLPPDTVLDGEVVVTDEQAHPDFEAVMTRFQTTNPINLTFHKLKKPYPDGNTALNYFTPKRWCLILQKTSLLNHLFFSF